uniref:Uncharacterized protein n=1 Tax=Rhizophora mucronata TaxID=61149 RepID=A0A2P2P015_RHIMU
MLHSFIGTLVYFLAYLERIGIGFHINISFYPFLSFWVADVENLGLKDSNYFSLSLTSSIFSIFFAI